jgi:protein phosphatase methylesterase 1
MPPGWEPSPADGAPWRKPHFDVSRVRRFDPPMSRGARVFVFASFSVVLVGATMLLWYASVLPFEALVVVAAAILGVLWMIGAVMQGRLGVARAVGIEVATVLLVLAAVSARAAAAPVTRADARVQAAVESARADFLAGVDFDRMHVTALVADGDGAWLRGDVEGEVLAYPASCVKLPFLVAAVHWCAEQGRSPDCLDEHVRPMIVESDNVAAGLVVDTITGATNGAVTGAGVEDWIERRRYTERVLESQGLLRGQRLFTKTYPTNSGEEPEGLERLAWERLGRNAMSADAAADLMLAVVSGAIEPQATAYMRRLLRRDPHSEHSALGAGLPAGSLHENKVGTAFDTLEDIMYAELPGGSRLIVAAFTNGWDPGIPAPGDVARLGRFTELLVARLGQKVPEL